MMFNTIKSLLLFFVFLLCSKNVFSFELTAEVDRNKLAINESLRLIVSVNASAQENINFSELNHQFEIITTQRSNQTSIINGSVSAKTQWTLILLPKETGQLIIPSFTYQGVFSQALAVTVVDDNSQSDKGDISDREIFFQASVNKNNLYVQEQLLVTLRLYYRTPLSGYEEEEFKIDDSTVTLVSERNLDTLVKGISYKVLEKIYAIHPQSSGELAIPAQSWRLEKSLNRFNFGSRSNNPYLYVRTNPIVVDVKSINDNSTADTWLPSTAVTLDQKWEQSIVEAKVGEPLNYQTILIGNGLTAAQLPNIELADTEHFIVYSDKATTEDTKSNIGIIGARINNFAVIPKQSGTFVFPESKIKWWNIKSQKEEVAIIPAQTIEVIEDAQASQSLPFLPENDSNLEEPKTSSILFWIGMVFLVALVCIALFVFFIYFRNNKRHISHYSEDQADSPSISSLKDLYQAIGLSIENKNWVDLNKNLLLWAATLSNKDSLTTLTDIASHYPILRSEIFALEQALYSSEKDRDQLSIDLESFLQKLKHCEKSLALPQQSASSSLKQLYKN